MTRQRIEKAIEVINYAIKNQISVREASLKQGYAETYIKNVKADVFEEYSNGSLDKELFNLFNEPYQKYLAGSLFNSPNITNKPYTTGSVTQGSATTESQEDLPPASDNKISYSKKTEKHAEIEWVGEEKHIKTLDQLIETCEIDLTTWRVKDHIINKWDVTSWKRGYPEVRQNFQVKARLERIQEMVDTINVVEVFKEMIKNYQAPALNTRLLPQTQSIEEYLPEEENLLEISIFDLHMGKLAWGGETGENYDTKIARERFLTSIETLLARASGFNYERILFPVGNDFFNSDTIYNTTTKGTPQDEDLRWQKTFQVGVTLLVDAINLLKQTGAAVDVVVVPGNHDFERSFYMGAYLEAWFREDKNVSVDNSATPRKYYRFGEVLLGLTHGSEEKESSLPMIMANDILSKPHWSETTYHEWHLGHQHRKKDVKYVTTNEDLGVTIRYLSSLTGTEEWHHKKGYVGQIKAADAFVWNAHLGLIAHLNSNLKI